jgi:hypothetical protein
MSKERHTAHFDDVKTLAETEKALLCVIDGEKHWIPHGQIDDDSEVYRKGDEGLLIVSEWIALKKRLI